jgi:DNA processing protein
MDPDRLAYLALTQVPGLGPSRLRSLLTVFESPLGAHSAPFELLCTVPGISKACATAIGRTPLSVGGRLVEQTERLGGRVLLPDDLEFPSILRTIHEPPPVLFALGDLKQLQSPALAIVGSRDHSAYGEAVARGAAAVAARAGLIVVSGMARGLDAVAHAAALDAGGGTIGVLGNGLGVIYPTANRRLYQRVAERGLLLTEFPPGERPSAGSFPQRNRLISGLARVTLVVEAAIGSGALITAGEAIEQGRDVLAVPGPITSAVSAGTNRLIRDGAGPYLEPVDLLAHYPGVTFVPDLPSAPDAPRPLPDTLTEDERAVAALVGRESVPLDALAARAGKPVGVLLAVLCGLELQGIVEQRPGRQFRRC